MSTCEDLTEEIRRRLPIERVFEHYGVKLRRAGKDLVCLCPFHTETAPSCHVHPDTGRWHCFGCPAKGDIFDFISEKHGVAFPEAKQIAAQICDVDLSAEEADPTAGRSRKRLFDLHQALAQHYHELLLSLPPDAPARQYLAQRQLEGQPIKDFLIGYAPESWDHARNFLKGQGFTDEEMLLSGVLCRKGEKGHVYERFRNRLMFPIRDGIGRIVGFSGRALCNDAPGGKYHNSPETPIFRKSELLFGLDRTAIVDENLAVLCEGYFDAVRCHSVGIRNVVAAMGTAITADHARLLLRRADEILLVLDADTAGEDATIRAADVFHEAGLPIRVVSLPEGEDPDSYILKEGAEAFRTRLKAAVPFIDFYVGVIRRREDPGCEAGMKRAVQALGEILKKVASAVQRDSMVLRAADLLGIAVEALRNDLGMPPLSSRPASGVEPERTQSKPIASAVASSFPVSALPRVFRDFIDLVCKVLKVQVDAVAASLLFSASALIGNSRRVSPRARWEEPVSLLIQILGFSGEGKSVAMQCGTTMVNKIQGEMNFRSQLRQREYEEDLRAWKSKPSRGRGCEPRRPAETRVLVDDRTLEGLLDAMVENPRGISSATDELESMYARMSPSLPNGQNESSRFLTLYTGLSWDQKLRTRGRIFVPRTFFSLIGCLVPDTLSRVCADGRFVQNGLLARFISLNPKPVDDSTWCEEGLPESAYTELDRLADALHGLQGVDGDHSAGGEVIPRILILSSDAKALWAVHYSSLMRRKFTFPRGSLSFACTARSLSRGLRIAAILQTVKFLSRESMSEMEIGAEALRDAITIEDFFLSETLRVYESLLQGSPGVRTDAERLALALEEEEGAKATLAYLGRRRLFSGDSRRLEAAAAALVNDDCAYWEDVPTGKQGGRPTKRLVLREQDS